MIHSLKLLWFLMSKLVTCFHEFVHHNFQQRITVIVGWAWCSIYVEMVWEQVYSLKVVPETVIAIRLA